MLIVCSWLPAPACRPINPPCELQLDENSLARCAAAAYKGPLMDQAVLCVYVQKSAAFNESVLPCKQPVPRGRSEAAANAEFATIHTPGLASCCAVYSRALHHTADWKHTSSAHALSAVLLLVLLQSRKPSASGVACCRAPAAASCWSFPAGPGRMRDTCMKHGHHTVWFHLQELQHHQPN
jgi:hypothetical protein